MHAKLTLTAMTICLLVGSVAARRASRSSFQAHTSGAATLTLAGSAEFGPVGDGSGPAFTLTMGATSPTGAIVITSPNGAPRAPGTYLLGEGPEDLHALVVTGSPTRPTGVYRARAGMVTISTMREGSAGEPAAMDGRFEIDAVGFEAANPAADDRPLAVRGTFVATAGR
jgi:hypothetical protein